MNYRKYDIDEIINQTIWAKVVDMEKEIKIKREKENNQKEKYHIIWFSLQLRAGVKKKKEPWEGKIRK